jgi:dihydrofolate reductase
MRDVVYYVATTVDGFIARTDGSFGEFVWDEAFGSYLLESFPETFPAHLRQGDEPNRRFDTVLMGRATYEIGLREGVTSPYPTMDQYLFSRTLERSPDAVTLVKSGAVDRVRELKGMEGKSIWLCGGSELAGALYAAGLIDELILKVSPVVFGEGKPLFGRAVDASRLVLGEVKSFESGHLLANYTVST